MLPLTAIRTHSKLCEGLGGVGNIFFGFASVPRRWMMRLPQGFEGRRVESEKTMTISLGNSGRAGIRTALLMLCTAAMVAVPVALRAQTPDTPPSGQQGPPPGGGHGRGGSGMEEHQIEHLTKMLNLTPDQVTKLKAVDDDTRTQMKALRDDTATPREEKRPKMEAIHKDQQAKVKAILTDDQKTKFEVMEAKMRERREEHRGEGGPPPPPPPPPSEL
jgi:protein CpxP